MRGFVICGEVYGTQNDTTQKDNTVDEDCFYLGKGPTEERGNPFGDWHKNETSGVDAAPGEDGGEEGGEVSGESAVVGKHPLGVGAAPPGDGGIEWFKVREEKCYIFPKGGTNDWISSYAAAQNDTSALLHENKHFPHVRNQTMSLLSRAGSRRNYGPVGIMLATDPGNAMRGCLDQHGKWASYPDPTRAYDPDKKVATNERDLIPAEVTLQYFHDLDKEIGEDIEQRLSEMARWGYRMAPYIEEMDGEEFYGVFGDNLNLTDAPASAYERQHGMFVECFDITKGRPVPTTPNVMLSFAFCPNAEPRQNDTRDGSYYWAKDATDYELDQSDRTMTRHRTKSEKAMKSYLFFRLGVFNAIVASLRGMQHAGVKLVIFDAMGCIYRPGKWEVPLRMEIHLICLAALVELKPHVFTEAVVPWYAPRLNPNNQAYVSEWQEAMRTAGKFRTAIKNCLNN